ncbi:hypothetical protein BDN72DRAFT_962094 [Pluteus cervinus]|uniref:Uncharacterized protein n=1 Tax=Pluteus cervinus TaxID=181527 RepID=A0ACD3AKI7_9AGAR|nr:hypothetical protein BDN72DRAFT_962094 [Pluteus cervinus]
MLSSVGRKQVTAHVCLYIVNIIVLALSTQVNSFQEYFFVADLFPFGLSIATLVLLSLLLLLDLTLEKSYTGRPQFEIGFFGIIAIFWLAVNAFSTSRWHQVPMACDAIPADSLDLRTWCKNLQALQVFVWVEWLLICGITLFTARFALSENSKGHKHVFKMPLSRYNRHIQLDGYNRGSEFLQYGKAW